MAYTNKPTFSIVLISEDGSSRSEIVLENIIKRTFSQRIDQSTQTQRIEFRPIRDRNLGDPSLERVVNSNCWKDRRSSGKADYINFIRYLSTMIGASHEMPRFVFIHFDGDVVFSNQAQCENRAVFVRKVLPAIAQVLQQKGMNTEFIDRSLGKIIQVVPFYSIESWLYCNYSDAQSFCDEHCQGNPACKAFFTSIANGGVEIDEIPQIKNRICFKSKCNFPLSETLPCDDAYAMSLSYKEFSDELERNNDIKSVLESTYSVPPPENE